MRSRLWPEDPRSRLRTEARHYFAGRGLSRAHGRPIPCCVLIAVEHQGRPAGFVEASLRSVVDGCGDGPVGYLEAWYVEPESRRAGVGRRLVRAAESWARSQGCSEMGSDALLANRVSEAAHVALGYEVVDRAVLFRRRLGRSTIRSARPRPRAGSSRRAPS